MRHPDVQPRRQIAPQHQCGVVLQVLLDTDVGAQTVAELLRENGASLQQHVGAGGIGAGCRARAAALHRVERATGQQQRYDL